MKEPKKGFKKFKSTETKEISSRDDVENELTVFDEDSDAEVLSLSDSEDDAPMRKAPSGKRKIQWDDDDYEYDDEQQKKQPPAKKNTSKMKKYPELSVVNSDDDFPRKKVAPTKRNHSSDGDLEFDNETQKQQDAKRRKGESSIGDFGTEEVDHDEPSTSSKKEPAMMSKRPLHKFEWVEFRFL